MVSVSYCLEPDPVRWSWLRAANSAEPAPSLLPISSHGRKCMGAMRTGHSV